MLEKKFINMREERRVNIIKNAKINGSVYGPGQFAYIKSTGELSRTKYIEAGAEFKFSNKDHGNVRGYIFKAQAVHYQIDHPLFTPKSPDPSVLTIEEIFNKLTGCFKLQKRNARLSKCQKARKCSILLRQSPEIIPIRKTSEELTHQDYYDTISLAIEPHPLLPRPTPYGNLLLTMMKENLYEDGKHTSEDFESIKVNAALKREHHVQAIKFMRFHKSMQISRKIYNDTGHILAYRFYYEQFYKIEKMIEDCQRESDDVDFLHLLVGVDIRDLTHFIRRLAIDGTSSEERCVNIPIHADGQDGCVSDEKLDKALGFINVMREASKDPQKAKEVDDYYLKRPNGEIANDLYKHFN